MNIKQALKCADDLAILQNKEELNHPFSLPHPYTIYEAIILLAKEYRCLLTHSTKIDKKE